MGSEFTVLTVCTGNLHRSALAHALLETWAGWYLPPSLSSSVRIASAGTQAPTGAGMPGATLEIAAALGADASGHRSRALTPDLLRSADLVLTASRAHRDEVLYWDPGSLRRVFTMREAGRIAGSLPAAGSPTTVAGLRALVAAMADNRSAAVPAADDDIVDPQGRTTDVLLEMAAQEVPPLADLAVALLGMSRPDREAYAAAAQKRDLLVTRP